jgi:hypothetical protein
MACGELHKAENRTVQATNGREGIIVTGLYNEDYADRVINPVTKEEITKYHFPNLESVIPDYKFNSDYEKVTVVIPKFRKKSRVNVVKTWEGIKFVEVNNSSEEVTEGKLCFQVNADRLNLFSGYEVDLYFDTFNQRSFIVIESLPELTENLSIKFTYVTAPNYIKRK